MTSEMPWQGEDRARPVGEVIRALVRRKRFYEKGRFGSLARAWTEMVGEAIARRTRLRDFTDGTLTVEVDSPALLHELNGFMKESLLAGLRGGGEGRDVNALRFRLASRGLEGDSQVV